MKTIKILGIRCKILDQDCLPFLEQSRDQFGNNQIPQFDDWLEQLISDNYFILHTNDKTPLLMRYYQGHCFYVCTFEKEQLSYLWRSEVPKHYFVEWFTKLQNSLFEFKPIQHKYEYIKLNEEHMIDSTGLKRLPQIIHHPKNFDELERSIAFTFAPKFQFIFDIYHKVILEFLNFCLWSTSHTNSKEDMLLIDHENIEFLFDWFCSPIISFFDSAKVKDKIYLFFGQAGAGKSRLLQLFERIWGKIVFIRNLDAFSDNQLKKTFKVDNTLKQMNGFLIDEFTVHKRVSSLVEAEIRNFASRDIYEKPTNYAVESEALKYNPAIAICSNHQIFLQQSSTEWTRRLHLINFTGKNWELPIYETLLEQKPKDFGTWIQNLTEDELDVLRSFFIAYASLVLQGEKHLRKANQKKTKIFTQKYYAEDFINAFRKYAKENPDRIFVKDDHLLWHKANYIAFQNWLRHLDNEDFEIEESLIDNKSEFRKKLNECLGKPIPRKTFSGIEYYNIVKLDRNILDENANVYEDDFDSLQNFSPDRELISQLGLDFLRNFEYASEFKQIVKANAVNEYFESRHLVKFPNDNEAHQYYCLNTPMSVLENLKKPRNIDIEMIDCFFVDIDDRKDYENLDFSIVPKPSAIINSGNGLHLLWVLSESVEANEQNSRIWQKTTKKLINHFKADPACKDLSRVFRLPGSYNCKDADKPKKCEILLQTDVVFDFEDFVDNAPQLNKKIDRPPRQTRQYHHQYSTEYNDDTKAFGIKLLENHGQNLFNEYKAYFAFIASAKFIGFTYDEIDPILRNSENYDGEQNRKHYESLNLNGSISEGTFFYHVWSTWKKLFKRERRAFCEKYEFNEKFVDAKR